MPLMINTNAVSIGAQRVFAESQTSATTAQQRLSSGMRINEAKDDAAGLAIADRMSSQIRGMNQATRNANDGLSVMQTAEGALSTSTDMLQRIRELAVQSSNASHSASDRHALNAEVNQLVLEINRVAQNTAFNGHSLLDGSMGSLDFQVGANSGQLISVTGANFTTGTYGLNRTIGLAAQVNYGNDNTAGTIAIQGAYGSASYTTTTNGDSAQKIADGINKVSADTGVTAKAQTDVTLLLDSKTSFRLELKGDNTDARTISFTVGSGKTAHDFASGITAINAHSAKTGVTASYDAEQSGIRLTHAAGADIRVKNANDAGGVGFGMLTFDRDGKGTSPTAIALGAEGTVGGAITLDSDHSFSIRDGVTAGGELSGSSALKAVSSLDVSTIKGAQLAIGIADAALARVGKQRAEYGAVQSRFSLSIANLNASNDNLSAARSRIRDADYASETGNLTRSQILQQSGTAMLAQANSLPSNVLSLLR